MILYRCGLLQHLDLSVKGSFLFDGRFHSKGRYIVYLTENAGSAMLETLIRLIPSKPSNINQRNYGVLELSVPDKFKVFTPKLKSDWRSNQFYTRTIGNQWYDQRNYELMKIPSTIVPDTFNYLLNISKIDLNSVKIT